MGTGTVPSLPRATTRAWAKVCARPCSFCEVGIPPPCSSTTGRTRIQARVLPLSMQSRPHLCMCPSVLAPCVLAPPPSTTLLRQAPPHPAASSPLPPPWALAPRWPRPRATVRQCQSPQALQAALWPQRHPGHPLGKGMAHPRRLPPNQPQWALQFGSRTCPASLSANSWCFAVELLCVCRVGYSGIAKW